MSISDEEIHVVKRNGNKELVQFDKILNRVKTIGLQHDLKIPYSGLVMKVIDQIFDGI